MKAFNQIDPFLSNKYRVYVSTAIICFCLMTVFILSGCAGGVSPWQQTAVPAEEAPKSLISESLGGDALQPAAVQAENLAAAGGVEASVEIDPQFRSRQSDGGGVRTGSNQEGFEQAFMSHELERQETPQATMLPSVKVALLVPLSGPHGELGQALLQASQMALFDLGFESFELLPRDTKGTASGARAAARSAVSSGAQLVLGPLFSGSVAAAKAEIKRSNVNMIAFSTDWTLAGGGTYIMGFLPFSQVERIARYSSVQGLEDIAILAPNTDYGNIVISAYNSYVYRNGLETAKVQRFPPGPTDISSIVRDFTNYDQRTALLERREEVGAASGAQDGGKMANKERLAESLIPFDAVLMPVGGDKARTIANLLSYYGLEPDQVRRLGTGLWDEQRLAGEPALADSWFAAPSPLLRQNFEQRFYSLYRYNPPRIATLAYDATALSAVLARTGLKRHGRPAFSRRYLTNPNGFAGLDGIFRFRDNGLVERGLAVLEFSDGEIVIRDEAPTTFQQSSAVSPRRRTQ